MTKETVALYLENGFKGRRNVISSRELERVLGISGNELRRRINLLRQDTVPIAADQRGYYFAETAAEVYHEAAWGRAAARGHYLRRQPLSGLVRGWSKGGTCR